MALTGKQRQYLRGLAHELSPIVRIGKAGVSDTVVTETSRSLESHELIKVRIDVDGSSERTELVKQLAEAVGAEVAGTIGKIAVLYKAREEEPAIKLPA